MSAIAYAEWFEAALEERRHAAEREGARWSWRVHPTEPDMLIVSRGPAHGEYSITDWACGCPAGRNGRFCCHWLELGRRWGDVATARRELQCK